MFSQPRPRYASPRPPGQRRGVDSQAGDVQGLLATVQQQLGLAGVIGPGREILHQDVGRAVQVGVLDVECHLMGRQRDLSTTLDHFELNHDKQPMGECQQAVWDAQVNPRLNPGEMAGGDVLFQPFVQGRFRFQCHLLRPQVGVSRSAGLLGLLVLLRSAWG